MVYVPNPQHRNASFAHAKSQWIISTPDEITCFTNASNEGWGQADVRWGLYIPLTSPAQLGVAQGGKGASYVAKFVVDQGQWHGYPVAHWMSPFDKPAFSVLQVWRTKGLINKATFAKINRGKKCNL